MMSAPSAPGPSLGTVCFWWSLQSAGPCRGSPASASPRRLPASQPAGGGRGPEGNVAESWGLPRTREAEALQKAPGECPWGITFLTLVGRGRVLPAASVTGGLRTEHGGCCGFGAVLFIYFFSIGGRDAGQMGHGAEALWGGEGGGPWPQVAVLGLQGLRQPAPASLPGLIHRGSS